MTYCSPMTPHLLGISAAAVVTGSVVLELFVSSPNAVTGSTATDGSVVGACVGGGSVGCAAVGITAGTLGSLGRLGGLCKSITYKFLI